MATTTRRLKAPDPLAWAEWSTLDAHAVRALERGDASADQQRRALAWIVERASMFYRQSFTPGMPDATAFIEGRRSVGAQIIFLTKLTREQLEAKRKTEAP